VGVVVVVVVGAGRTEGTTVMKRKSREAAIVYKVCLNQNERLQNGLLGWVK
jgi:hypothetical protein